MDIKTMSKKAIRNWDINSVVKRLETKRKRKEKLLRRKK